MIKRGGALNQSGKGLKILETGRSGESHLILREAQTPRAAAQAEKGSGEEKQAPELPLQGTPETFPWIARVTLCQGKQRNQQYADKVQAQAQGMSRQRHPAGGAPEAGRKRHRKLRRSLLWGGGTVADISSPLQMLPLLSYGMSLAQSPLLQAFIFQHN